MDPRFTHSQQAFRAEVRSFLAAHWDADVYAADVAAVLAGSGARVGPWHRRLFDAGLVAPHWPVEHGGRGLGLIERWILNEELGRAGAPKPGNVFGIGWAGSTILAFGTDEQKARFLPPILDGSEIWCQLFSEPDAGSDLAGLATHGYRDGDEWVVSGQKIWNTMAHVADWGILLVRTDPDAKKHKGITYFLVDMETPGIEVRRIRQMTGHSGFCEVFFDDVRIPHENIIGPLHGGWSVAVATLISERVDLSASDGLLWGNPPTFHQFWEMAIAQNKHGDPVIRDQLAGLYAAHRAVELTKLRVLSSAADGQMPGTEVAVQKLMSDELGQRVAEAAFELRSDTNDGSDPWTDVFLFSAALTIGGGTTEVQKNIIGERILGLPPEPAPPRPRPE